MFAGDTDYTILEPGRVVIRTTTHPTVERTGEATNRPKKLYFIQLLTAESLDVLQSSNHDYLHVRVVQYVQYGLHACS